MMKTKLKIGFIGLGNMGLPMAANLVKSGFFVSAFDLNVNIHKTATDNGIILTKDIASLAQDVDVFITMLPDSPDVEEVVLGEKGLIHYAKPKSILIDMSSINPLTSQKIAKALDEKGVDSLDAPVSGGVSGAISGKLSIMVGGDKKIFELVQPVLTSMGQTITYVGPHGSGQAVKLCNQIICAINIQAICEAMALGNALDLDLNVMQKVLMGGSADSWMLRNLAPKMIDDDSSAGFRIALQLKDLRTAFQTAFQLGVPLPGLGLVTNLYLEARAHQEDGNGNQALYCTYDRMANQTDKHK
jgi:2-hydroxy-3-oxopropionate reductase